MWVRDHDVHILSVGEKMFTSNHRFSAKYNSNQEWVLIIKHVKVVVILIKLNNSWGQDGGGEL